MLHNKHNLPELTDLKSYLGSQLKPAYIKGLGYNLLHSRRDTELCSGAGKDDPCHYSVPCSIVSITTSTELFTASCGKM